MATLLGYANMKVCILGYCRVTDWIGIKGLMP